MSARPVRLLNAFAAARPEAQFVEVGANDGRTLDPLASFIDSHRWRGIMVEPVPHVFERLRRNFEDNPRVAVANVAIADRPGTRPFFHLAQVEEGEEGREGPWWDDAIGSFDREHLLRHADEIPRFQERLREIEVPTTTLAELCREHSLEPELILIDAEGHDAEVIEAIDFERTRPRLLIYEHCHLTAEESQRTDERLSSLGYELLVEGPDAWCLDLTVDDELSAQWRGLIAAEPTP